MPNVDKGAPVKTLVPCNVCGRGWPAGEMTKLDLGKNTWDARICDGCTQLVVRTWLQRNPKIFIEIFATKAKGMTKERVKAYLGLVERRLQRRKP
jgi:hypothetical protein